MGATSGGGSETRPPPARLAAGALLLRRGLARLELLLAARRAHLQQADEYDQGRVLRARLRRGHHPKHLQPQAVGDVGPRRQVQGEHVPARRRGAGVWPQADELPRPLHALQAPQALLPRAAPPHGRLRRAAPQRALGRAHRPHARAPLPAGRRAHLLHGLADQAGDRQRARHDLDHLRLARDGLFAQPLDQARERAWRRRGVGDRRGDDRGGARRVPGKERPRMVPQPGRRRLLRAEDRHPCLRRPQAAVPVRDGPARLRAAAALRPQVHGFGRRGGCCRGAQGRGGGERGGCPTAWLRAARHDSPRSARIGRADDRHPHGALRRQVALLPLAAAGDGDGCLARLRGVREGRAETSAEGGLLRRPGRQPPHAQQDGARGAAVAVQFHPRRRKGGGGRGGRQCAHARQRGARQEDGRGSSRRLQAAPRRPQVTR
mmetsp:Transcript_47664/g.158893  ORF Transcript_47664/g.158893 Transcript_47664/m.158893 type:complete len:434 (+) Transcript_47664:1110-2411(+)